MNENRKPYNNQTESNEEKFDKYVDHLWELIEQIKPYNREVLESMTKEERRTYNIGYCVIGVLCVIVGILDGLCNLIAGEGLGAAPLYFIGGVGCLLYYWNPFCYANLWKYVQEAITKIHK